MNVTRIEKDAWTEHFAEHAHKIAFGEKQSPQDQRIDYALFVVDEGDSPCGYITVREWDSETAYWQFGGALPKAKGNIKSWRAYEASVQWTKEKGYKRIATYIENNNRAMLRFAERAGFVITGVRNFKGSILLEHLMEFDNGN